MPVMHHVLIPPAWVSDACNGERLDSSCFTYIIMLHRGTATGRVATQFLLCFRYNEQCSPEGEAKKLHVPALTLATRRGM